MWPQVAFTLCFMFDFCFNQACGHCINVTSSGGIIQSPEFPSDYGNNRNCLYHLWAPQGNIIRLSFTTFVVAEDCDYLFVSTFFIKNFIDLNQRV